MTGLLKYLFGLTLCLMMSFTGKSQKPSGNNLTRSQIQKLYIGWLQNKAKDTVIQLQEQRISTLQQAIREQFVKDSMRQVFEFKLDSIRKDQNNSVLQSVAQLNKQVRWHKLKGGLFTGTTIAAVVYIVVKMVVK